MYFTKYFFFHQLRKKYRRPDPATTEEITLAFYVRGMGPCCIKPTIYEKVIWITKSKILTAGRCEAINRACLRWEASDPSAATNIGNNATF